MTLILVSFLAGILTVLAPCTLSLLPVIVGGSLADGKKRSPAVITASLAVSVVLFTLLLKVSSAFVNIPQAVWAAISGAIIIGFGMATLFPVWWSRASVGLGFSRASEQWLAQSAAKKSRWGDVLLGMSLGPVFASCSPTYFLILATVLPQDFAAGLIDLIAYAIGMSLFLFLIAILGQRMIQKVRWAANPNGWFRRSLGALFVLVGLLIATGRLQTIELALLGRGWFDIGKIEVKLTPAVVLAPTAVVKKSPMINNPKSGLPQYKEIVGPSGYVNTDKITMGELIGKKVVLVDFLTYTCINCIRTFPYMNAWYDKYRDQGLEIVGIHTPEFAFEKKYDNVAAAMKEFGIRFPIVLDNDYATWRAYGNNYWPRKYLIDIYGNIVYDHIGEGGYEETEGRIQEALKERMAVLGERKSVSTDRARPANTQEVERGAVGSPETYFGSLRNEFLGNGIPGSVGVQHFDAPADVRSNTLYLVGDWNMTDEYAESVGPAKIIYRYLAKRLNLVASGTAGIHIRVLRDGQPLGVAAGRDAAGGMVTISADRLYELVHDPESTGEHTIEIIIEKPGLKAFAFTFG